MPCVLSPFTSAGKKRKTILREAEELCVWAALDQMNGYFNRSLKTCNESAIGKTGAESDKLSRLFVRSYP
jgi:hypothetical protein